MKKVLIINGHEPYSFSEGKLSAAFVEIMQGALVDKGCEVRTVSTSSEASYDVEKEVENHVWADCVILQVPVNWMAAPWSLKKYMDLVYTAGIGPGGMLLDDGRTSQDPKKNYGTGGLLDGKKYMFSFTFNAPKEAFNDENEYLFQGKSVDDLFFWMHMNFRFFNMTGLESFVSYDVMKNPEIESDIVRLKAHIDANF